MRWAVFVTQKLALKIVSMKEFPEMVGTMAALLERSLAPPTEATLRGNVFSEFAILEHLLKRRFHDDDGVSE